MLLIIFKEKIKRRLFLRKKNPPTNQNNTQYTDNQKHNPNSHTTNYILYII